MVTETLENSGSFINISWDSGNSFMETCLYECHSHSAHVVLNGIQIATK